MDRGRLTLETSAKDADAAAIGRYLSV
jgi:hypothetical protein